MFDLQAQAEAFNDDGGRASEASLGDVDCRGVLKGRVVLGDDADQHTGDEAALHRDKDVPCETHGEHDGGGAAGVEDADAEDSVAQGPEQAVHVRLLLGGANHENADDRAKDAERCELQQHEHTAQDRLQRTQA